MKKNNGKPNLTCNRYKNHFHLCGNMKTKVITLANHNEANPKQLQNHF